MIEPWMIGKALSPLGLLLLLVIRPLTRWIYRNMRESPLKRFLFITWR